MGLRIIGGIYKGKQLSTLKGHSVRPTSGLVRESIFNILSEHVLGTTVLDLFAGTGALGIEALSRGAHHAVFIDFNRKAIGAIGQNLKRCGAEGISKIIRWDVRKDLKCIFSYTPKFDLIFIDPPYNNGAVLSSLNHLDTVQSINDKAIVVIEHGWKEPIPDHDRFKIADQRKYGKTLVSFLNYVV